MVDLDFERRMNPWLFDSSGNLTEAAKKQFPDLATVASGAPAPSWTPATPGTPGPAGPTLTVSPDALRKAANNAATLQTKFTQACRKPFERLHEATEDLPRGWALVGALWTADEVWMAQVNALDAALGRVSEFLGTNADSYARAEQSNAQNFGKG
ncbi:WXG100 family type VII secretion target [Kitasatospora sp. NPDC127111]|uniref:WXG100 family type VII secretion target n=1 Tax=Kitasatospora sp. NPDC127111 TaxID=3345363 RepID=UPI0036255F1E